MDAKSELESLVCSNQPNIAQCRSIQQRIAMSLAEQSPNCQRPNFQSLESRDLRFLMEQYDTQFFSGLCVACINENRDNLSFRVSNRMTSAGGKTTVEMTGARRKSQSEVVYFPQRNFEIAISAILLFSTGFEAKQTIAVAGVKCSNRLEALLRIFEHELIHLIEFLIWDDSSCAANRFKNIARCWFGHRQSNHQLITPSESAAQNIGIGVGDRVGFQHGGRSLVGYINHINRRATVLVPDVKGTRYTDGKRYAKYYVPLSRLKPVKLNLKRKIS